MLENRIRTMLVLSYVIWLCCWTTVYGIPVMQNEETKLQELQGTERPEDVENENTRKVLGSSVVTSVSVIMETKNGSHKYFADAAGRPVARPTTSSQLASPVTLINPDRYEFYTFNDDGDLVKREMTLVEIQKIIAAGGSEDDVTNLDDAYRPEEYQIKNSETRVHDVVANVQSVLKEEIAAHKNNHINTSEKIQLPDLSELSASWTMFGNGDDAQDIAIIPDIEMMDEASDPAIIPPKLSTIPKLPATSTEAAVPVEAKTTEKLPETTSEVVEEVSTQKLPEPQSSTTKQPELLEENIPTLKSNEIETEKTTTEVTEVTKLETSSEIQPDLVTKVSISVDDKLDDLSTEKVDSELKIEDASTTVPSKLVTWIPDLSSSSTTTERLTTIQEIITTTTQATTLSNEITTEKLDELEVQNTKFVQIASSNDDKTTTVEESVSTTEETPLKSSTIQEIELTTELAPRESTTAVSEEPSTTEAISNTTPVDILNILADKTNLKSSLLIDSVDQIIAQVTDNILNDFTTNSESNEVAESMINFINTTQSDANKTMNQFQSDAATIASSLTDQIALTTTEVITEEPDLATTTEFIESDSNEVTENAQADATNVDEIALLSKEVLDTATTEETIPESTTKLEMSIIRETSSTSVKMGANDVTEEISTEDDVAATTELFDLEAAFKTKYEELEMKDDAGVTTTEINEIVSQTEFMEEVVPTTTEKDLSDESSESVEESSTTESSEERVETSTSTSSDERPDSTTSSSSEEKLDVSTESSEEKLETSTVPFEEISTQENLKDEATTTERPLIEEESSEIAESSNIETFTTNETPTTEKIEIESTTTFELLAKLPIKNTSNIALRLDETKIFPIIKEISTTEFPEKFTTIQYVETTQKPSPKPAKSDLELEKQMLEAEEKILATTTTENSPTENESTTLKTIADNQEIAFSKPIPENILVPQNLNVEQTTTAVKESTTIQFNENTELADEPSTVTEKQLPTTIQLPDATKKNAWKIVPIIPHVSEKDKVKKPKPDIKPLKSGIFNFQGRPNVYRPSSSASTYSSNINLNPTPAENLGLEATTVSQSEDLNQFTQLCNELAFKIWSTVTSKGISSVRSVFMSPFAVTSMLAMVFLGARGPTSGEMNDILKLDDMVTFNPHLVFRNVTESIEMNKYSGVAKSVIIRELFSDRTKGKLLDFYKERARQFYDGHVEEANYKIIGNLVKHRTNLLVRRQTGEKITDYIKGNLISLRPPLAALSANIFQTDCTLGSTEGRDGELHFIVSPTIRQRRLVPVPAVVYRTGFLAGYEPELDATAIAMGNDQVVSMIYVVPGQQGNAAPGDGLSRLEKHLTDLAFKTSAWSKLLRTLSPRPGLEIQIPRFSHRSVINATQALQKMGLRELFNPSKADLRGLNGNKNELHLSDMIQVNNFTTCGESVVSERTHHIEVYPAVPIRLSKSDDDDLQEDLDFFNEDGIRDSKYLEYADEPRDYQRAFHDPVHDPSIMELPLALRPRQARIPDSPRLRLDRPFLYFVRHNPTGLILHMGRFNPRLLP